MMKRWGLMLCAVAVWSCAEMGSAQTASAPVKLKDGEPALPVGYQNGPKFLSGVQRPDIKQVRELFMAVSSSKCNG